MSYQVEKHILKRDGNAVTFQATNNMGGMIKPVFLVMHYTAGMRLDGAVNWFKQPSASASAHLVIDRDGTVVQMVPFNRVAWHAGKSVWGPIVGLNQYSIGIELVNAGKLKRLEDGRWVNWANNVVSPNEVVVLTHKDEKTPAGWQVFPEAQVERAIEVAQALHAKYAFEDVVGHDDIAPLRKVDPGPAFPMISFESRVIGRS